MIEQIAELLGQPAIVKALTLAVSLTVVAVVARMVRRSVTRRIGNSLLRYRARKLVALVAYFFVAVILLVAYSDRLGGLTVALGVAGAGIAFALQEVIVSVAGWIAVSFGNFYTIGDRVQLGGIKGDVIDIGVLRTTLMEVGQWVDADLYNGRIVRVANSFVFKEPVFNYSADFPFLWDEITVPVRYGSDWKHARTMLERIVEEVCGDFARSSHEAWQSTIRRYALEAERIEPVVTLKTTDNWLEFTVRFVVDYRQRRATKSRLFSRILEEVDNSAGRIRLASATFEVVNLPHLEIAMGKERASVDSHYAP